MTGPHGPADTGETGFAEAIDWPSATITARGRLTEQALDLLSGSAEVLHRSGHATVTLDLHAVRALDEGAHDALRALASGLHANHSELVVLFGLLANEDVADDGNAG
jgi:hypothetical protein